MFFMFIMTAFGTYIVESTYKCSVLQGSFFGAQGYTFTQFVLENYHYPSVCPPLSAIASYLVQFSVVLLLLQQLDFKPH